MPNTGGGRRYRAGIDVGGTFTDVVLVEETSGEILTAKVATVPADPSRGCIHGIDKALARYGLEPGQISFTVHGTTVATNTIIQRKYALAGLITSEGFRDVLEIAYQTRPKLYDIFYDKPEPLVPRYLARGVPERIGPDGVVIVPLDEDAVRAVARELVGRRRRGDRGGVPACLPGSAHERRAGQILAEECGDLPIVLSSDISPEYREYPRTSTTVVNAVLLPRVGPYIARLEQRLETRGIRSGLHFMTSAGGIIAAGVARRQPVHLVESGPAAGVIGAAFVARLSGYDESAGARHRRHDRQGRRGQSGRAADRRAVRGRIVRGCDGDGAARTRLPGPDPGDQPGRDRRGRRQHRQARSRGRADRRARKRGRRSWPGLLRPGRHRADADRCQPRARAAQPGLLPRRRDEARPGARGAGRARAGRGAGRARVCWRPRARSSTSPTPG